jgi:hypothetical protein
MSMPSVCTSDCDILLDCFACLGCSETEKLYLLIVIKNLKWNYSNLGGQFTAFSEE